MAAALLIRFLKPINQWQNNMKQYFITVDYTQSNLSAMERDLLDQARPFNNCLIIEPQIDVLVDYFRKVQEAFHKAKPRLKTVDISKWMTGIGTCYIHIGQITLHLQEVYSLPPIFNNFLIKGEL